MKKITAIILFAVLSLVSIISVSANESAGKSSENINSLKKRKVIKAALGKFAESASKYYKYHRIILTREGHSTNQYKGSVYIRHKLRSRAVEYVLPQPKNTWSIMEPQAIFFANADNDADNELLIIERNMTGIGPSGSRPFFRTRVYDWNGRKFRHLEKVSESIGGARTEARVKLILKSLTKPEKPAEYIKMNTGEFNRKVRLAARKGEFWVKMPTIVAVNFVGKFSETKTRTVEMTAPTAEETNQLTVIITDEGYLDDSVRGERYRLRLRADPAGIWYVLKAEKAQSCYRGHKDFSAAPCL
jgi:hypothetical protein